MPSDPFDLTGHTADFAGESVSLKALDGLRRLNLAAMPIVQTKERIGSCVASTPETKRRIERSG